MSFLLKNKFSILFLFSIFTFISCSKDSDDPVPTEITVTTADFSLTMDENPTNGQSIGTIQGSTNNGSVSFSITAQTPSGAFSIDASSGELKVDDAILFDFETNPTITGTVQLANGVVSENASVVITLNDLNEENVYEGNIYLKTQEELNIFGANNYTRITGSMTIGNAEGIGVSDVSDLSPLNALEIIDNTLLFINNPDLSSTEGLNINYIGGQFAIIDNPSLISILGFNISNSLSNGLFIYGNSMLSNLSGLSQLSSIGGSVTISSCPLIQNLDWLGNLNSIEIGLFINNCDSLTNIDGFSNLNNLGFEISIMSNQNLNNINGFQNLTTNIRDLSISNNPSLLSITGLGNINVTNRFDISENDSLQNLHGLENITYFLGSGTISNNDSLVDLEGLNNLSSIDFLEISLNENLIGLNGLSNLFNINSNLQIDKNSILTNFCDLQNLIINGNVGSYIVYLNAYNPTKQDIIDGNCSL